MGAGVGCAAGVAAAGCVCGCGCACAAAVAVGCAAAGVVALAGGTPVEGVDDAPEHAAAKASVKPSRRASGARVRRCSMVTHLTRISCATHALECSKATRENYLRLVRG